jgi:hypothetical protein
MDSDAPTTLPQGVTHQKQQDYDIVAWSNKNIAKDWSSFLVFIVFWIMSIFVAGRLTYALVAGEFTGVALPNKLFSLYFLVGSLCLILYLPIALYRGVTATESIIISNTEVVLLKSRHEKRFAKSEISSLLFGRSKIGDGIDFMPALYFIYKRQLWEVQGMSNEQLALWMRIKEKRQLFFILEQILKERGWDIEYQLKHSTTQQKKL